MEKETSKEVATTTTGKDVALTGEMGLALFRDEQANKLPTGFEETDSECFKMPLMGLLQSGSPEVKRSDPKYIDGAYEGQYCNKVTREVFDDLELIVLAIKPCLVAWKPDLGGFAGRYSIKDRSKVIVSPPTIYPALDCDGNKVQDTMEYWCVSPGRPNDIFVLPFSGTNYKYAKAFNSLIESIEIDVVGEDGKTRKERVGFCWAGVYRIGSCDESGKGNTWKVTGYTPTLQRYITLEERHNLVIPAMKKIATVEDVDYRDDPEGVGSASSAQKEDPIY